jgi:hypothetical protein
MEHRNHRKASRRDRKHAQEEWILDFLKHRFNVSQSKIKDITLKVGNSYQAILACLVNERQHNLS